MTRLVDENAYGVLLSYFDIEEAEYGSEPEEFAARVSRFREILLSHLSAEPPAEPFHWLYLGHAVYLEFAEGDERLDPFQWLKSARQLLEAEEISCVAVLTHGGRWVPEEHEQADRGGEAISQSSPLTGAQSGGCLWSGPSEPFRRAFYAETASHAGSDEELSPGWGPGLYVDTEAVEAMGKQLKNAPTPLDSAGATFYRFGR